MKRTCNREFDKREKTTEKLLGQSNQQAASLLSVLVLVVPGFVLAHCQVESKGEEAD